MGEGLETGYGPGTPPGDNLCLDYVRGMVDGFAELAAAGGQAALEDGDLAVTDAGSPSPFANAVVMRRPLGEDAWRAAATRMAGFFGVRPGGGYLVFSAWPTPDLAPLGLSLVGHPPLMLRPPGALDVPAVAGLAIREVDGEDDAADWERTLVDGFPVTDLQPHRPGCLLPPAALAVPGWRHWVADLDGAPAACASARVAATHVDVQFVATLGTARRRGIGAAVTAVATMAAPGLPAMLLASDPGRPVYERLGYRALLRFTLWLGRRPA